MISDDLFAHLSLLVWEHINLIEDFVWKAGGGPKPSDKPRTRRMPSGDTQVRGDKQSGRRQPAYRPRCFSRRFVPFSLSIRNKRICIGAMTAVNEAVFAYVVKCNRALAAGPQFLLSTRLPLPASVLLVVRDASAEKRADWCAAREPRVDVASEPSRCASTGPVPTFQAAHSLHSRACRSVDQRLIAQLNSVCVGGQATRITFSIILTVMEEIASARSRSVPTSKINASRRRPASHGGSSHSSS